MRYCFGALNFTDRSPNDYGEQKNQFCVPPNGLDWMACSRPERRLRAPLAWRMKRKVHYEQRDGEAENAVAGSFHPILAEDSGSARGV